MKKQTNKVAASALLMCLALVGCERKTESESLKSVYEEYKNAANGIVAVAEAHKRGLEIKPEENEKIEMNFSSAHLYSSYSMLAEKNYSLIVHDSILNDGGVREVTSLSHLVSTEDGKSNAVNVVPCKKSPFGCLDFVVQNVDSVPRGSVKVSYVISEFDDKGGRGIFSKPLIVNIDNINPGEFGRVEIPIGQEGEWVGKPTSSVNVFVSTTGYMLQVLKPSIVASALTPYSTVSKGATSLFSITPSQMDEWEEVNTDVIEFASDIKNALKPFDLELSKFSIEQKKEFFVWLTKSKKDTEQLYAIIELVERIRVMPPNRLSKELEQISSLAKF
jgi:hypothetical protein